MTDRDPNIVHSSLCGIVTRDGITVELAIYRLEDTPGWTLEVVNDKGTSTVWDEQFASDDDAHREFLMAVEQDGMNSFLDQAVVIPFRR